MTTTEPLPLALDALTFTNRFTAELPGDPDAGPTQRRRQVHGACWSPAEPTEVAAPQLIAWSSEVAESLDLPADPGDDAPAFAEVLTGNRLLPGMAPFAMCYGGHQFGNWAGQLGDGRAIALGEVLTRSGDHLTLQLKGAGPTPYSRTADGLAVLRSSIREFLCSEAMHHLGVPTTRALSLCLTGEQVVRDMFYDGHPRPEPGAVVCRVAPSFTRFGNFEIFAARGELDLLRELVEFTMRADFGHLGDIDNAAIMSWFAEVCRRTAELMAHWMAVGFVHGVMNTDNLSILGLTIDYGPYGWIDDFDPSWTPNTTDAANRRYRFGNQPHIGQWNLLQLANALYPLIEDAEPFQEALNSYVETFDTAHRASMGAKLGLDRHEEGDADLLEGLFAAMQVTETDMTIFHRNLADVPADGDDDARLAAIADAWYLEPDRDGRAVVAAWLSRWVARITRDGDTTERREAMRGTNPKYVLRNYLAQQVIDAAEAGDYAPIGELLEVLRRPYDDQPGRDAYAAKRPDWARDRPGCSTLSCSS